MSNNCHVHTEKLAVGGCSSCGKYICSICLNKVSGKYLCDLCTRFENKEPLKKNTNSVLSSNSVLNKNVELFNVNNIFILGSLILMFVLFSNLNQGTFIVLSLLSIPFFYVFYKNNKKKLTYQQSQEIKNLILEFAHKNSGKISASQISTTCNINYELIEQEIYELVSIGAVIQHLNEENGSIQYFLSPSNQLTP